MNTLLMYAIVLARVYIAYCGELVFYFLCDHSGILGMNQGPPTIKGPGKPLKVPVKLMLYSIKLNKRLTVFN